MRLSVHRKNVEAVKVAEKDDEEHKTISPLVLSHKVSSINN